MGSVISGLNTYESGGERRMVASLFDGQKLAVMEGKSEL